MMMLVIDAVQLFVKHIVDRHCAVENIAREIFVSSKVISCL